MITSVPGRWNILCIMFMIISFFMIIIIVLVINILLTCTKTPEWPHHFTKGTLLNLFYSATFLLKCQKQDRNESGHVGVFEETILPVSTILLSDFGTVPDSVAFLAFHFVSIKSKYLIILIIKYPNKIWRLIVFDPFLIIMMIIIIIITMYYYHYYYYYYYSFFLQHMKLSGAVLRNDSHNDHEVGYDDKSMYIVVHKGLKFCTVAAHLGIFWGA